MTKLSSHIYLDYAATSPLRPEVIKVTRQLEDTFGNPASIHSYGQAALNIVDRGRREVAEILQCNPSEIVFTSSGTEADNLAIKGVALKHKKGHIITTAIEHKAVLESCKFLETQGYEVTYINPTKEGTIKVSDILAAIQDNTILISVMYVNNEVGTIQPIVVLGEKLREVNRTRDKKILFHTDAVQAGVLLDLNVKALRVDLMTLSGHKLGGPKGVGLLYVRDGVKLTALLHGGGQERGVRSGTLNALGIAGLATALIISQGNKTKEEIRLAKLQNHLIKNLKELPAVTINGSLRDRISSNVNFSIKDRPSDELVVSLDLQGIAVSAASACSSGSIEPSYVITAMGFSDRATSSLRVTMGWNTTKSDIDRLIKSLKKIL